MQSAEAPKLDSIVLELLLNAMKSITDEAFVALTRSAYSTNIKERHDHSTAIIDTAGRLVVQAKQSLPIHLASMTGMVEALLASHREDIREGDIFIGNDPYLAGGSHLPDVNMALPVFRDGRPVAFLCNIAHHADIGGMTPGSMAGGMTEIYQEGLRIPIIKLFRQGVLQGDILRLLLSNARGEDERRGDYYAQVAACKLGARRFHEVIGTYGLGMVELGFDEIIERTEQRMRAAIRDIPDGVYRFQDVMDDDGLEATDIPIALAITISDDRIVFDFTGSARQVPGNINVTRNATLASVCFALKALLDPEVPNNDGVIRVPELVTEAGSIVDAVAPAAVAARAHTCQRIVDLVIGALAPCMPERAVAAANGANTTAVFAGVDPRTGASYVYLETLGGGVGGRQARDGKDGVQVNITNTSNLPVEAIELEYPLMVEEYGFVHDSGGGGRHRGGLGLRRVVRPVDHSCMFSGAGERFSNRPWGLFGGLPGGTGRFQLRTADSRLTRLANKPAGVLVRETEAIVVESPGAGGYGQPDERSVEAIERDHRSAKFTEEFLKSTYPGLAARTAKGE